VVFRAGDADLDLFVVESGAIEILNAADGDRHIVTHGPRQFAGDIDLLTRRPVIVNAVARGKTKLPRVPGPRLREMLNKAPHVSEKLLIAATKRRELLSQSRVLGCKSSAPASAATPCRFASFL
jgi:thioredoxin reductase (NADPH)